MYNLDLPEVIKYRNRLIPESERNLNISHSVFDYNWINKIEFSRESGTFFISGGFIYYFEEEKISKLLKMLASKFPEGELIFDIVSNLAKKIINKRAEKAESNLRFKLAMDAPTEIIPLWSKKIEIKDCFVIGKRTSLSKKIKFKTRVMNKLSQWMKTSRIVHLKFLE